MAEGERVPPPAAPPAHLSRPLPAIVRFLFVVAAGAAGATLASYLLRQIGL
jgi:hypothetical protein